MQTCPGFFLKSLLESPGNLLEICSVKFVDTLYKEHSSHLIWPDLISSELSTLWLAVTNHACTQFRWNEVKWNDQDELRWVNMIDMNGPLDWYDIPSQPARTKKQAASYCQQPIKILTTSAVIISQVTNWSIVKNSNQLKMSTEGICDYRIQIHFHSETRFRFSWQIEWPFSSKEHNPW